MKFSDFLLDRQIFENGYNQLTPAVSVVMPTYARHAEGLLAPCIESVLAQTFTNFEFIIVDDGSSDGSEQLIKKYAAADARIVYVRHDLNSGLPAVRTDEAILMARADTVAFIFDDNLWYPDTLETLLNHLNTSGAELAHGHVLMPRANAEPIVYGTTPPTLEMMLNANTIPNGVVAARCTFFEKAGLYDPHLILRRICDWDLWLRALKMGIQVEFIDRVLGVEQGIVSPSSLGNTVKLDFKVALAYLQDDRTFHARCAVLTPGAILEYDPFDVEKAVCYCRDLAEWQQVEAQVYTPFFSKHPTFSFEPLLKNNRRYDNARSGYRLNSIAPVFKHRSRIGIITNRVTRFVQDWYQALTADTDNIVLVLSQLSMELLEPEDLDQILLLDVCNSSMLVHLAMYFKLHVPITYVLVHGLDTPSDSLPNPLKQIEDDLPITYSKMIGIPIYLAAPGKPWPEDALPIAQSILNLADQVILVGDLNAEVFSGLEKAYKLPFIPNINSDELELPDQFSLAVYLGNAEELTPVTLRALERSLRAAEKRCKIFIHPHTVLPAGLKTINTIDTTVTLDSPAVVAEKLQNTCLLLPAEILARLSTYQKNLLEEDLAGNHSILLPIDGSLENVLAATPVAVEELKERLRNRSLGMPQQARHLHFRNLMAGVQFRRRIATLRGQEHARDIKSMVFINSQSFSGSEAYGLLVGYALNRLGFDIQVCTQRSFDVNPQGMKNIQDWLSEWQLGPLALAEYGKIVRSLHIPELPEKELMQYASQLDAWLETQEVGMVFCAGFISEPAIIRRLSRLVFMALFAPWDYPLDRMTYLRGRIAGLVSDTQWAANLWGRWMLPPIACVPSLVQPEQFIVRNEDLPAAPVRIAVTGTIQPRKRQKEAVLAVRELIARGYDLELNLYGYLMEGCSPYINEIKEIAEDPQLAGRVTFHGFVEEMSQISRENHIILSTSADESLPQGIVFNQAAGLIAVACPAGGIGEMVVDGVTGYLTNDFSVEQIVIALRRALDARTNWPEMIRRTRQFVAERCSEPIFSKRLLNVMSAGAEIYQSDGMGLFRPGRGVNRMDGQENPPARIKTSASLMSDWSNLVIGPDLSLNPLTYNLTVGDKTLCGLQFRVGTFLTRPKGKLKIEIYRRANKSPLYVFETACDAMTDNAWVKLPFDPLENSANQTFRVKISANLSEGRIALYESLPLRMRKFNTLRVSTERYLIHYVRLPRPFQAVFALHKNI